MGRRSSALLSSSSGRTASSRATSRTPRPSLNAFFATSADLSYPMTGTSAVMMITFCSSSHFARSSSASMPSTILVRITSAPDARRSIDSRRLWAINGIITLSSKLPFAPPHVMAASLPITWLATCIIISEMTGFTLPGMIELPGWSEGSVISAMPVRGPLDIQRRSLAILKRETATVLSAPDALTAASLAAWASKWFGASTKS